MRERLKSKGFEVIALNSADKDAAIRDVWSEGGFTIPVAGNAGDAENAFQVEAYPTNFVVDQSGKIIAKFEGFDEQGIVDALAKAGVK